MRLGELYRYLLHVNPTLFAHETDMERIQSRLPKRSRDSRSEPIKRPSAQERHAAPPGCHRIGIVITPAWIGHYHFNSNQGDRGRGTRQPPPRWRRAQPGVRWGVGLVQAVALTPFRRIIRFSPLPFRCHALVTLGRRATTPGQNGQPHPKTGRSEAKMPRNSGGDTQLPIIGIYVKPAAFVFLKFGELSPAATDKHHILWSRALNPPVLKDSRIRLARE
jgi:hypothetical protein